MFDLPSRACTGSSNVLGARETEPNRTPKASGMWTLNWGLGFRS